VHTQKPKAMKKSSRRISDDTKCPIHSIANHTWGECFSNAANKTKPKPNSEKGKKCPEKAKKDKVDSHAAHLASDAMSIKSSTTVHGTLDSLSTASELCCQQVVNDDLTVSTINNSLFTQLCLDLNHQVDDLNALVAKFKADHAAATNTEVNNGMYTYDAFTSTTTHHLHDLLFHAMQEVNTTVYGEIVGLYVQHSDEVYSSGVSNISNVLPFDQALRL
jgi:hypothetical protein